VAAQSPGAPDNWIKLLKAGTFVRNYLIPVGTSFSVSTSPDLHISGIATNSRIAVVNGGMSERELRDSALRSARDM